MNRKLIACWVPWVALVCISVALGLMLGGGVAEARSSGIFDYSGNPDAGDGETCVSCHLQGAGSASIQVIAPSEIVGGETTQITVEVSGEPGRLAGFSASFGDLAGTLSSVDSATRTGRSQVTHVSPEPMVDGTARFTFEWTAPVSAQTAVLFVSAAAANGDGTTGGDHLTSGTHLVNVSAGEVRGDVNCDGELNIVDALLIAQYVVGNRSDGGDCPLANPVSQLVAAKADFDRDGAATIVDALLIARCSAGISAPICEAP